MNEIWLMLSIFFGICLYYMLKNRLAFFFPSSKVIIDVVMEFADIKKRDVFYDLGSGDGRILFEVAKRGIKVVGIEQNRLLNWIARRKTRKFNNIKIIQGDIFDQNISDATVIVAYLSRKLTLKLQKKIKKGTRIILIDHPFKDWKPIKMRKIGIISVRLYIKK